MYWGGYDKNREIDTIQDECLFSGIVDLDNDLVINLNVSEFSGWDIAKLI